MIRSMIMILKIEIFPLQWALKTSCTIYFRIIHLTLNNNLLIFNEL